MRDEAQTLPGIDLELDGSTSSPLRQAVQRTLRALDEAGLLQPMHAAQCQLALELADSIARSGGKASAAAMASAQLLACLETLPKPTELGVDDKFEQWLDEQLKADA